MIGKRYYSKRLEEQAAQMRERYDWVIRLRERARKQPRSSNGFNRFAKPDGSYVPRPAVQKKREASGLLVMDSPKNAPHLSGIKVSIAKIEAEHPHLAGPLDRLSKRPTMTWKEFKRDYQRKQRLLQQKGGVA